MAEAEVEEATETVLLAKLDIGTDDTELTLELVLATALEVVAGIEMLTELLKVEDTADELNGTELTVEALERSDDEGTSELLATLLVELNTEEITEEGMAKLLTTLLAELTTEETSDEEGAMELLITLLTEPTTKETSDEVGAAEPLTELITEEMSDDKEAMELLTTLLAELMANDETTAELLIVALVEMTDEAADEKTRAELLTPLERAELTTLDEAIELTALVPEVAELDMLWVLEDEAMLVWLLTLELAWVEEAGGEALLISLETAEVAEETSLLGVTIELSGEADGAMEELGVASFELTDGTTEELLASALDEEPASAVTVELGVGSGVGLGVGVDGGQPAMVGMLSFVIYIYDRFEDTEESDLLQANSLHVGNAAQKE